MRSKLNEEQERRETSMKTVSEHSSLVDLKFISSYHFVSIVFNSICSVLIHLDVNEVIVI